MLKLLQPFRAYWKGEIRLLSQKSPSRERIKVGPSLKDFLAPANPVSSDADAQWDKAPYLQDEDIKANGRKGKIKWDNLGHLTFVTL